MDSRPIQIIVVPLQVLVLVSTDGYSSDSMLDFSHLSAPGQYAEIDEWWAPVAASADMELHVRGVLHSAQCIHGGQV